MTVARTSVQKVAPDRLPAVPVRAPASATITRQLQQRLGNQGTQRLIAAAAARSAASTATVQLTADDKSGMRVSSPSDPAELEAQATGKAIASMAPAAKGRSINIDRQSQAGSALQRDGAGEQRAGPELSARIQASQTGGAPLPAGVRDFMTSRFQANFSRVRIHTGAQAAQLSTQLNARAFTVGQHIFFGQGQFAPDTHAGRELIAHELTHTIQQGASVQRSTGDVIQREGLDLPSLDDVLDFGETAGWKLLEQVAPAAVPIVKKGPEGVLDWLKERAGNAFEAVLNGLMAPVHAIAGAGQQLSSQFAPMLASLQSAAAKIARNDCTPLREAAEKIEKTAERLITPIVEKLQPVVTKVKSFLDGVWDKFGAPIWNWIKQYAGVQWDAIKLIGGQIQAAANWIWDKTAAVRALANKAWTWLKNKLGIGKGAEGKDGLLQWVQRKLEAASTIVKAKLEPFKKELTVIGKVVGTVALAVSPAGPVLAIGAAVVGTVQGLRWIATNWGKGNLIVQSRDYLEKSLIPTLLGAANRLGTAVAGLAGTLSSALGSLAAGMARTVAAIDGAMFGLIAKAVQWLAGQAAALAAWATTELGQFKHWLGQALGKLKAFLGTMKTLFIKVGKVVLDIWLLPMLLAEKVWDAIPACIRDPVVDFLGPIILRQIEIFQELVRDDDAWQKTRASVTKIVRMVFKHGDLMGAIRETFHLILRVFNVPAELLVTLVRKAAGAWDVVSKKPLQFIKNTVRSLGHGFRLLWANFGTHLKFGLEGWLFGELKEKNIPPPKSWLAPGDVFNFALDVLGLSVNHMWELVAKRFDPDKVAVVRKRIGQAAAALDWINKAVDTTRTPAENARGMIVQAKDFAIGILGDIATWVAGRVAQELALMAAAAAASAGLSEVLDIARRIYKAIVTATRWLRKILDMVNQTLDNVIAIAAGAVEQVGASFEKIMHLGMPVVVAFLADQVGLGGVGEALRKAVDKLRAKVDQAILWLIDKVKAGLGALVNLAAAGLAALKNWWSMRKPVQGSDGVPHSLYFAGSGMNAVLTVASKPISVGNFLTAIASLVASSTDPKVQQAYPAAQDLWENIGTMRTALEDPKNLRHPAAVDQLNEAMTKLAENMAYLTPLHFAPLPPAELPTLKDLVQLNSPKNALARVLSIEPLEHDARIKMFQMKIVKHRENSQVGATPRYSSRGYGIDFWKYDGDLRYAYMGSNPEKGSQTYKDVIDRMKAKNKIRDNTTQEVLNLRDNRWYPIAECELGHIVDAVRWWNVEGRMYGVGSDQVQEFMINPANYELEPSSQNLSRGGKLKDRYLPPLV